MAIVVKREGSKRLGDVKFRITPSGEIDLTRLSYPAYLRTRKTLAHLEGQKLGIEMALRHMGTEVDRLSQAMERGLDEPAEALRPGSKIWEAQHELQRATRVIRFLLYGLDKEIVWRKEQGYSSDELDGTPQKPFPG